MDECIIKSDLEEFQDMINRLSVKYGDDLSCTVALGIDSLENDQTVCNSCININGNYDDICYLMELLMNKPIVLIAVMDVIGDSFAKAIENEPEFRKNVMLKVMENIKMKVILENKELKTKFKMFEEEEQAKEVVDDFLKNFYKGSA